MSVTLIRDRFEGWRGVDVGLWELQPKRGTFFNHLATQTDLLTLSFRPHTDEEPFYPPYCSLSALGLSSAVAPPWRHLHTCTSSLHVVGPEGPLHKDITSLNFFYFLQF